MIKSKRIFVWILALLPLIATMVMMAYLPDMIPVHYNFAGEVDRMGSKFELLIVPLCLLATIILIEVFGAVMSRKSQAYMRNEKAIFIIELAICVIFTALTFFTCYLAFANTQNLTQTKVDIFKIMAINFSLCWIIIGNVLPKCKQNAFIGIRTSWTLGNEKVWYKTHRMGGLLMFLFGMVSLVCSIILSGYVTLIISVGGLTVLTVPIIIYSYIVYNRETQNVGHLKQGRLSSEESVKDIDANITIAELMNKLKNNDGRDVIASFVWAKTNWDSSKSEKENLERFSKVVQNVIIIESYMDEVNNGGHYQFYFNSSGKFADLLEEAIIESGIVEIQNIAATANEMFYKAKNRNGGKQSTDFFLDDESDVLSECDDRFYDLDDIGYARLEEYVEKNKNNRFYK